MFFFFIWVEWENKYCVKGKIKYNDVWLLFVIKIEKKFIGFVLRINQN